MPCPRPARRRGARASAPCRSARTPPAARTESQTQCRRPPSACARSDLPARRTTGPSTRVRASMRPRSGRASSGWSRNARPMSGSATFATARFRFATAATRISAASTHPARRGLVEGASSPTPPSARCAGGRAPLISRGAGRDAERSLTPAPGSIVEVRGLPAWFSQLTGAPAGRSLGARCGCRSGQRPRWFGSCSQARR